jgi:hypothetical protein
LGDPPALPQVNPYFVNVDSTKWFKQPGSEEIHAMRKGAIVYWTGSPNQFKDGATWIEVQNLLGVSGWLDLADLAYYPPKDYENEVCGDGDKLRMIGYIDSIAELGKIGYFAQSETEGVISGFAIPSTHYELMEVEYTTYTLINLRAYFLNANDGVPMGNIAVGMMNNAKNEYTSFINEGNSYEKDIEIITTPNQMFRFYTPAGTFIYPKGIDWLSCKPTDWISQGVCEVALNLVNGSFYNSDFMLLDSKVLINTQPLIGFQLDFFPAPSLPTGFDECVKN